MSVHTEQGVVVEWRAVELGGKTVIAHDVPEGEVDAYLVTGESRNPRTLVTDDAALYEGKVVDAVFDEDTRTVEFYHTFAGYIDRISVAEWLEEPAIQLQELPRTEVAT